MDIHFIHESKFDEALFKLISDPVKADELLRRIEARFRCILNGKRSVVEGEMFINVDGYLVHYCMKDCTIHLLKLVWTM